MTLTLIRRLRNSFSHQEHGKKWSEDKRKYQNVRWTRQHDPVTAVTVDKPVLDYNSCAYNTVTYEVLPIIPSVCGNKRPYSPNTTCVLRHTYWILTSGSKLYARVRNLNNALKMKYWIKLVVFDKDFCFVPHGYVLTWMLIR